MNIKDALNQCTTQRVKISSKDGSGWWFAGDKSKFKIALANAAMVNYHRHRVANAIESCVSACKATITDYEDWAKRQKSRYADTSRKAYSEWLDAARKNRERFEETAIERKAEMRAAVPIAAREVVEVSEADYAAEPIPCTRIVLSGAEDGAFWACAEAEQAGTPLCFGSISSGTQDE